MKPIVKDFGAGTYHWCTCGGSTKQPFCDGTHEVLNQKNSTEFEPLAVNVNDGIKAWCTCKQTSEAPFCDGSHEKE